ncbi:MAG: hypothetical protein QOH17_1791, partial [Pseudonocardiales bacterium]|nr:hypothetical protein [Pseudonocardiales bacterium]
MLTTLACGRNVCFSSDMADPGWGLCTYRGADRADALGALRHADG